MKTEVFKKIIKESVREVIREELKEILLEAVRAPKLPLKENIILSSNPKDQQPETVIDRRKAYMDILEQTKNGNRELNMNTNDLVLRGPIDTTSEGSKLPDGEVSLDRIMKITGGGF